jgi:predicted ATPase
MAGRHPGAPVRRLSIDPGQAADSRWPYTVPSIGHVLKHGLDLDPGITVLIGANGTGKSTLVEAVAAVWAKRITAFRSDWLQQSMGRPAAEDSPLHEAMRLEYTYGGPVGGLFLRAERLHAQAEGFGIGRWSERIANPILERSHGEGFLQVLSGMVAEPGFYVLDEPESALSFDSSLMLLTLMADMRAAGSQILLATHSPILAAAPNATLLQLDETGISPVVYDETDLVQCWRSFLNNPDGFLRYLT